MARFDQIAVYMMANKPNGTLYTGATSDLTSRIAQHASGHGSRFTERYGCVRLVWFELFDDMAEALHRERRIKTWPRAWKINLIREKNPAWDDLAPSLAGLW